MRRRCTIPSRIAFRPPPTVAGVREVLGEQFDLERDFLVMLLKEAKRIGVVLSDCVATSAAHKLAERYRRDVRRNAEVWRREWKSWNFIDCWRLGYDIARSVNTIKVLCDLSNDFQHKTYIAAITFAIDHEKFVYDIALDAPEEALHHWEIYCLDKSNRVKSTLAKRIRSMIYPCAIGRMSIFALQASIERGLLVD